ncbi:hypothetical protein HYQ44_012766 [Verticillium longisporum]|nr:hypothetical protein HYQ44_012766 [Verticillium longisporum]
MATKSPAYTWENGFRAYVTPPSVDLTTSLTHNQLGINVVRHWPTLYDGTNSPHGVPSWWAPKEEVDVLICGAGPSGLQVAVSLARQGVSFRIIDKADTPLAEDLEFLGQFFKAHAQFLLGVDCPYAESAAVSSSGLDLTPKGGHPPAIRVKSGVRAPNPRVCLSPTESGYLLVNAGSDFFHGISIRGTTGFSTLWHGYDQNTQDAPQNRSLYDSP